MNPWPVLVEFPGPSALLPVWRDCLAEAFEPFNQAFLEPAPKLALAIECPRRCGCRHRIMPGHNGTFIAYCMCDPPTCPDITVKAEDITGYKPSWTKLTRAVSQDLSLDHKLLPLDEPNTWQIGSWSPSAIPVFLTIRAEFIPFRLVAAQLVARHQKPFILLTPTNEPFHAAADELLHHARAAAFSLEATVSLTEQGTLVPLKPPGELFAQFRPEPQESVAEETARQVWALARRLDAGSGVRKAPPLRVFLFYCRDALSAGEIARRCQCGKRLVFTRLSWLRARLGRNLEELRQYSDHFQRMEDSLADPRARRIYRKAAAFGQDEEEEDT